MSQEFIQFDWAGKTYRFKNPGGFFPPLYFELPNGKILEIAWFKVGNDGKQGWQPNSIKLLIPVLLNRVKETAADPE